RDAIDPGPQAALSPKRADAAEDLQENLLHDVTGFPAIADQPANEVEHRLLEADDQRFVRSFGTQPQLAHQRLVFRRDGSLAAHAFGRRVQMQTDDVRHGFHLTRLYPQRGLVLYS